MVQPNIRRQNNRFKIWIGILLAVCAVLIFLLGDVIHLKNVWKNEDETKTVVSEEILSQTKSASAALTAAVTPTEMPTNTALPTEIPTETIVPTLAPADWQNWPVIPESVSDKMKQVYQAGLDAGNNPAVFSKIGDSNSVMPSFLSCYDFGSKGYDLGPYANLQPVITQFQWSFSRYSRGTKNGATAADMDGYNWYDDNVCWPYESALNCEYRLNNPSIAFIMFGTNDALMDSKIFREHLKSLVQKTLDRNIVPILGTKIDNLEGDNSFNEIIAETAAENEVPLWNLWRAEQPLPNHGLKEGDVHPTANDTSLCNFSGEDLQKYGWTMRNLTALQVLDRVWRLLTDQNG